MLLKEKFPDELAQSDLDQIYNYINRIHKWPIRTNADELTYQLHIIIRYEIERDLISWKITINNVKEIWNK